MIQPPREITPSVPSEQIGRQILLIRGQKVLLDSELAKLYGVTTARLNQQVRRNIARFPRDFAFLLTEKETAILRLQFATSSSGKDGMTKKRGPLSEPRIFTHL